MKPSSRRPTNKRASAAQFRRSTTRTKMANMNTPMRGGWRL